MSFLNKFFKKQQKEILEKQAEKQQKAAEILKVEKKPAKAKKPAKISFAKLSSKKGEVKISAKIQKRKFNIDAYKVLVKPLITEKISSMAADGKYGFSVTPEANKILIKKAVGAIYGVNVRAVKIINMQGKSIRYGRQIGKRKDWKKAIVTVAQGEKIEIYEGV